MATQSAPSLDQLGITAAVYPSEDQLWTQGPPINDPGGQGVEGIGDDGTGNAGLEGAPPVPQSLAQAQVTDEWIWETLNGETSNITPDIQVVVPQDVYGPQGIGDPNVQAYESGHTQIVQSNPSAEQGWGVGPARRFATYPKHYGGNPFRNRMVRVRNGSLPWVTAESSLYERSGLAWEAQFAPYKQRGPVNPVVPVASTVPFTNTVPTYGGGDIQYPGIDVPVIANEGGVY